MPQVNNDTALIPLLPEVNGLDIRHRELQCSVFRERREKALVEVRMLTGIPALVRELKPAEVYRLVVPSGQVLQKGKDGLFRGVIFGSDGKIAQHAKFEQVPVNLAHAASAVGAQIMLVSIAMQLNRIEVAIAGISEELHDERIAQILAGIRLYETAMRFTSQVNRDFEIHHAIQTLVEGLSKVRFELRRRIADLPESTNLFKDNWRLKSKASLASNKLRLAEESLMASVQGASVLAQCYAALNEPSVGIDAFSDCLQDIASCGVESAAEKARMAEVKNLNLLPETPWIQFKATHRSFMQEADHVHRRLACPEQGGVTIEFTKNELLEEI